MKHICKNGPLALQIFSHSLATTTIGYQKGHYRKTTETLNGLPAWEWHNSKNPNAK
jgi:hypothetical protein